MPYEIAFERNDAGLIEDVLVDGVSITKNKKRFSTGKSFLSALKKAQTTSYWKEYTESQKCENPFGGFRVLPPFEASIYTWILRWNLRYERNLTNPKAWEAPIQVFDNMRYFMLALDSDAYYALID